MMMMMKAKGKNQNERNVKLNEKGNVCGSSLADTKPKHCFPTWGSKLGLTGGETVRVSDLKDEKSTIGSSSCLPRGFSISQKGKL